MPTDALLIERIEQPASPHGYYAMIFDEDGKALKNSPVPLSLAPYTQAANSDFVFNMPGDAQQPWRFWIRLLCANMMLPNNPYGCHYRVLIFSRDSAGVENPLTDHLEEVQEVIWLQRRAYSRLDPIQEQIIAALSGQAVFAADTLANSGVPGSFGQFFHVAIPEYVFESIAPMLSEIHSRVIAQPEELAPARYQVKVASSYDDELSQLSFVGWLEKDGTTYTAVTSLTIILKDATDTEVASLTNVTPGSSSQFNVVLEGIELIPDRVYFVDATIVTADEPPREFTSSVPLTTWD